MKYIITRDETLRIVFLLMFLAQGCIVFGQSTDTGTVLIISDSKAYLTIDGNDQGLIEDGKPMRIELKLGEHFIQFIHASTGAEKSSVLHILKGKQVVQRIEFNEKLKPILESIPVVNGHLAIPGLTNDQNGDGTVVYYAFEKGDEILLSFDLQNNNGKCSIAVFTYPGLNVVYSKSDVRQLKDVKIDVAERGIYGFQLTTSAVLDRTGHLEISRLPNNNSTKDFNTEVLLVDVQTPVTVTETQSFYINSGSNALFKGGNSRVILPIRLPPGTVKWYYRFSASRDENIVNQVENTTTLFSELSVIIDQSGLLAGGIQFLSNPPGADYCEIYLLDGSNTQAFLNKSDFKHYPQAGRLNFTHGNVEVDFILPEEMYLGFKNPDNRHGIHIVVEVVAILGKQELKMKN